MRVRNAFFLVVLVALLASLGLTWSLLAPPQVYGVQSYILNVTLGNDSTMGFGIGRPGFHFGTLPAGAGGRRILAINNVERPTRLVFVIQGDIAPLVEEVEPLLVQPGEEYNISLQAVHITGYPFGTYEGTLHVIFQEP